MVYPFLLMQLYISMLVVFEARSIVNIFLLIWSIVELNTQVFSSILTYLVSFRLLVLIDGHHYFVTIKDDHSSYCFCFLMHHKSE